MKESKKERKKIKSERKKGMCIEKKMSEKKMSENKI